MNPIVIVIVVGVVLLMILAVAIGASMDTEAQRREWRRVAEARRELRQVMQLRAAEAELCERCPYRSHS